MVYIPLLQAQAVVVEATDQTVHRHQASAVEMEQALVEAVVQVQPMYATLQERQVQVQAGVLVLFGPVAIGLFLQRVLPIYNL